MTTTNIEQLERQIEQLVGEHLAAVRAAASAAVYRALGAPTAVPKPTRPQRGSPSGRRTPEQIAALGERLYEALCAQPGQTMSVLAPQLGATPVELQRPMAVLKRAGRVRSVGKRQRTRYFPMAASNRT
ncbi:MAG: hypothetical protein MJD61_00715 [Proteobacteria bacterium]|nr:hypothetical protein [Pseudomonadota bacterium]